MGIAGWIILLLILAAVIIVVAAWFYERATNEISLLRTGVGGRRVVIDGGVLAIPYFHEISKVNMATLRLDVARQGESSLITQDRLRVDVGAEFYVSVVPDEDAITRAAQTLGQRTFQRDELRALIDGMMVDALRSVAARMTMDELHENRAQFVAEVRDMLGEALGRYGLQLDNVSLTALDQTPFAALDENNAFNAVGMRKLAEVIAKSKKERAEIDAESEVAVRRAAMEASRKRLEIDLEERRAEIAQAQEIETLAAAQIAEVAARKADSERAATQAKIEMERSIQAAEVQREQALTIAEQDRQIAIAAKSQEESRAQVEADAARAEAVKASEAVETARALAEAERRAQLNQVNAEAEAKTAATRAAIAAESDKATSKDRAAARREEAEAEKAAQVAQADANRARIEAENARSEALVAMELEKARLEAMPGIVAQMVKPAEKIKSINVNHVTGLGGSGSGSGEAGHKTPVGAAMDSIMEMAVQLPLLKKLGDQMGLSLDETLEAKDNPDRNKG
ncbi:Inner membrane protein YqiK [Candidatus Rhodobacter oscarellae]|uniref:Inner membrane protein YqiK n=1 Tax=Candidatus Rhodobacter oscarellae TaxID=1675527 RepID=A0A0J9E3S9_9RHOB|nr:flotillin domain-containing protein [Candidatus Rhodobacter lobularis]KMW57461.1 Inner membrane protein YqiK [Candidatus Rhodobacter lobularis]